MHSFSIFIARLFFLSLFLIFECSQANEKKTKEPPRDELLVVASRTLLDDKTNRANTNVISEEQIAFANIEHIQQILSQAPGVSYQRGDGQESLPGIRSAVLTGAGACGNILILEEGIPVRGPAFCNVNELFDTHFEHSSQIEITKGPGTSFYGSNSLTGSINVALPSETESAVSVEVGEHDYRRAKLKLGYNGGENADYNGSLFITTTDTDSFRDESGYSQQKISWRHSQNTGDWNIKSGITATNLDQETAGFIEGADSYLDEAASRENLNPEAFRKTKSLRAWSRITRFLSEHENIQFTPFVRTTDMEFRLHFLPGAPLEENSQTGFGWQSSYTNGVNPNLQWSIGLDTDFSRGELRQTQDTPTTGSAFLQETIPVGVHYDYRVDSTQVGVFANVNWKPSDRSLIVAGIRSEYLEYDYDNLSLDGRTRDDGTTCGFGGCRYSRPPDSNDSFNNLSPKVELNYWLSDKLRVSGTVASSFRAPQATELYRLQREQQATDLDNVRVQNFELGLEYTSDNFHLLASVYKLEQKNVIIRDSDFFNIDSNRIHSQGVELSLDHKISTSLSWRASVTVAEHKYASGQLSGGQNINGNLVDTAPKTIANVALSWSPIPALQSQIEVNHVGEYFLEPENERVYPGHEVLNFRSNYKVNDRLDLSLRILNLTDKRFAERADFTTFTDERYFPGAPRTAFIGFEYKLN